MLKIKYIIIIILVAGTFSCKKIIDYKIPDNGRKLVLNSFISTNDSINVNISKSLHILDNGNYELISDAVVNLFEDGVFIETLKHNGYGNYNSTLNFTPKEGKTYKIEAWNDELEKVTASETIPHKIKINSIDTAQVVFASTDDFFGSDEEQEVYEFKINFQDNADEKNYYMIKFKTAYVYEYNGDSIYDIYDAGYIMYNDVIIERYLSYQNAVIFSDDLFDGETLSLSLYMNKYNFYSENTPVIIELYSISESYYKYSISLDQQQEIDGNPFAEPVQVYNNIEKGYGIFAGYTVDKDTLYIDGVEQYYGID